VKSWLDGVVSAYAQRSGISGRGGGGAVINGEEFLKFQSDQQKFAAQHVELYMLTYDVTHGQERSPSIRKKPPVWRCKPSSTVSTASMAMLILKEYNLALTSSRLAISTHHGIGFVKTLCLCTMISFLVGLPPSIEKSPRVALPRYFTSYFNLYNLKILIENLYVRQF
jgi:hypothetical protein